MTPHALITGGQQGIGLGIARALALAGFGITLAAERPEDDPAVQAACSVTWGRYIRHDLARDDPDALLDAAEACAGPVTTLVSNAGVPSPRRGDMLEVTPESLGAVMGVNLHGAFFLAQAVARRMLDLPETPYRSLIFVTSVSADMASPERAEYCLSKAGAGMMARLFALRLAPHGIGVYDLRPGIIDTAMTSAVRETYTARIEGGLVPAARWGLPADIGSVAVPLASGAFAFATGAVIPVDGGLSIPRL